eukprot:TRINITY_DN1382_c0_g1_i4.p1 TRINITY_DN1382_c0_g1~~TRINITY_DN1382_c0_g1_i4.p1  ORF type:complete len:148 (-),score=22.03 TRINITY_DN1382_c0_g1_i4:117-536(-)
MNSTTPKSARAIAALALVGSFPSAFAMSDDWGAEDHKGIIMLSGGLLLFMLIMFGVYFFVLRKKQATPRSSEMSWVAPHSDPRSQSPFPATNPYYGYNLRFPPPEFAHMSSGEWFAYLENQVCIYSVFMCVFMCLCLCV